MAPRQSDLSPVQRSSLIAAIMLLLLGSSLTISYFLTRNQGRRWAEVVVGSSLQQVGDLRVAIPKGWSRVEDAPAIPGLSLSQTFEDPDDPDHQLTIALLHTGTPQTPASALNFGLYLLVGDKPVKGLGPSDVAPMNAPPLMGLRFAILTREADGSTKEHFLAAMTEDGRRYWLIYLTQDVPVGDLRRQQITNNVRLLEAICLTAVDTAYRDGTSKDLDAAGLFPESAAKSMPEDLRVRVPAGDALHAAVHFLPQDAALGLRYLRVRAVPDAGATDPDDPLSPQALLADELRLAGTATGWEGDITQTQMGSIKLWHAELPHIGASDHQAGLRRQLWFARLSPGHGAVIESIAEPVADARLTALVPKIVAALAHAAASLPDRRQEVQAAINRGVWVAQSMRDHLEQNLAPDWRYELIQRDSDVMGYAITRNSGLELNDTFGDPNSMPLHGFVDDVLLGTGGGIENQWHCSRDGLRCYVISQEVPLNVPKDKMRSSDTEFEQQYGELQTMHGPLNSRITRPSIEATPPGFILPMAMGHWPGTLPRDLAGKPAVVWIRWGSGPPIAYWLECSVLAGPATRPQTMPSLILPPDMADRSDPTTRPAATIAPAGHEPVAQMLLWPMMGMDPTRIILDETGEVLQVDRRHQSCSPADPDEVSYYLIDRASLLKQFPKLKATFDKLEQKDKAP